MRRPGGSEIKVDLWMEMKAINSIEWLRQPVVCGLQWSRGYSRGSETTGADGMTLLSVPVINNV